MHLESIELYHVALPLKKPQEINGRPCTALETVLVRLESGGVPGWGEASPGCAPMAGEEWAAGAFALLRDWLAPAVVGTTLDSGEDLQARLRPFHGNQHAKAALDTAWWDLAARLQGRPLHQLLGGVRTAIEVGPTFDRMASIDEFLACLGRALDAGFSRLKLKFRPGWEVEMLRVVRQEFPTERLHVDCEAGLGLQHMDMLCRLNDFNLAMIEQPLPADDLVGHAMVQETVRTPIGLDESIRTPAQAEMALDLHSCRYMSLKPGRVGGLTPALAIHDACRANSVPCWVGATPQSALGVRFHLALAAKENCSYPADYFASGDLLAEDLAEPLLPGRDPGDGLMRIALWSEPGVGVEPNSNMLSRFCVAQAKLRA